LSGSYSKEFSEEGAVIISVPRFSTRFTFSVAMFALTYFVVMVFGLHRHEEYWALVVGAAFAVYPLVPKLPEEPEIKPEKYTLFPT
jgi:hypothetical protein